MGEVDGYSQQHGPRESLNAIWAAVKQAPIPTAMFPASTAPRIPQASIATPVAAIPERYMSRRSILPITDWVSIDLNHSWDGHDRSTGWMMRVLTEHGHPSGDDVGRTDTHVEIKRVGLVHPRALQAVTCFSA